MRAIRVIASIVAALVSLGCLPPAHAQSPSGAKIYSQGITGQAAPCVACHGSQGQGVAPFPRVAGLPAQYIVDQLNAYRNGTRPNAVMRTIVKLLDAQQIRAVADYMARLAGPYLPAGAASAAARTTGARLVTLGKWSKGVPACADCHGPALRGGGPAVPPISGQPETYLLGQLQAFRDGTRPAGPVGVMVHVAAQLEPTELQAAAAYVASLREGQVPKIPREQKSTWKPQAQNPDDFVPPPESALPSNPEDAKAVLLGERIFSNTPKYAPKYTGNTLSCRNCHTDRGRNAVSSPMWAAVPIYPKYRSKNHTVNTFAMRIQGCFRYSENGTPPPPESKEMVALMTYMHWLATGMPIGVKPKASGYPRLAAPAKKPDRLRGKTVYAADCAACHGQDGHGSAVAGAQVFPPLWGPESFNWGAGMHSVDKAAAFIYANMPFGKAGALTVQQAWDVAAWIDSHPRPQDPRFTESIEKTRALYHKHPEYDYYGQKVDGRTLGE